jgi:predicted acetyltransferase
MNVAPPQLRLLPVRPRDFDAATAAHADERWPPFTFLLGYDPGEPWSTYLGSLHAVRQGVDLRTGEVPATFLLAWVGGELVGRTSIRHELNEHLGTYGGHVGYGVVPAHRHRGYATEILRQSVVIARSVGVTDVLVTCDEHNTGSAQTIERCGGVLDSIIDQPDGGPRKRRYWIH